MFLLLGQPLLMGCTTKNAFQLSAEGYVITSHRDSISEQWATYAFNHLSKRTENNAIVEYRNSESLKDIPIKYKVIRFEINPNLDEDYCIDHHPDYIGLKLKDEQTALWMIYQLIETIAQEDFRFEASDLPPAIISFKTGCSTGDFSYREPHFSPNLQQEYAPIIGTNNLETDWGLWGHNLKNIISNADDSAYYALVNGKRNKEQLCFAAPETYKDLTQYIVDNFGNGNRHSYNFMISPQDNHLVCQDELCQKLGNTKDNATPAVFYLVKQLAERFPKHRFFMTAYKTNKLPPKEKLPDNAGVFLSTINLPKGVELHSDQRFTQQFLQLFKEWKSVTDQIYIWDYASNYDDYLTPIPVLTSLQKQLQFYKKLGIKGVFLNGSGYDYSTFDDLKTYVAAALMIDTHQDIDKLVRHYLQKLYPHYHNFLSDYYISLEESFAQKKIPYPLYGGMNEILHTYLDPEKFTSFYLDLRDAVSHSSGDEQKRLKKLYIALTFTRLQIAYAKDSGKLGFTKKKGHKINVKPEVDQWLSVLREHANYTDLQNYKETSGFLKDYVKEWDSIIACGSFKNLLMNAPVELKSKPDEGFAEVTLLNDGVPGFAMDYHQGWFISSEDDLQIQFPTKELQNAQNISLRFLQQKEHGFYSPERIELYIDEKFIKSFTDKEIYIKGQLATCSIDINFNESEKVTLKFIQRRDKNKSAIACDEIRIN